MEEPRLTTQDNQDEQEPKTFHNNRGVIRGKSVFINWICDIVPYERPDILIPEIGLGLVLHEVFDEFGLLVEPAFQEEGEYPNGQSEETQMKNELLLVRWAKPPIHILSVMRVVVDEEPRHHLTNHT